MSKLIDLDVLKITPSRCEDFEACPLRFKMLHLEGLGPRGKKVSKHLSLGSSVHECLRAFHEGGGHQVFEREALRRLLDRSWVAEGYANEAEGDEYRGEALRMCEAYYDAYRDEPTRHLGHELFVQARLRLEGVSVLLSGKIDRLSQWPDGRAEVLDYKTGGAAPSPAKLATSVSAFLYYALARLNYPDYERVDVSYLYLKTMTKVTAAFDPDAVAEGKARLVRMVRQIKDGLFVPKPNGHCGWCEVRHLCPAMRQEEVDLSDLI